ncbi:MAG: hypothetical protein A3A51_00345 [Candidatus Levybacteria bacterium RIFCSPLOWO2_01_FULL_39_10]|nr:MAG: hypothetical protein A3A51_00345 [Candidatus Levybacteria bacterium RIFCSPLOWO2_01_FULL_39_10]
MAAEFGPQVPGSVKPEATTPVIPHESRPPSEGTASQVVFDLDRMSREERMKHYIAQQFALGPLGDTTVTSSRFKPNGVELSDHIPYEGSLAEESSPWGMEIVDPNRQFSSPEERAYLIDYYRSLLTPEQREAIELSEKER